MKPFAFLILIIALASCNGNRKISNTDLSELYEKESADNIRLYPYRYHKDSLKLYLAIDASSLLFERNEDHLFESKIQIRANVFESYEKSQTTDTASIFHSEVNQDPAQYVMQLEMKMKLPNHKNFVIKLELFDLVKKQKQIRFFSIENSSDQSAINFLVKDVESGIPLYDYVSRSGKLVSIAHRSREQRILFQRSYFKSFPLAPPPFSEKATYSFSYKSDEWKRLGFEDQTTLMLDRQGIYHYQWDTLSMSGLSIFVFNEDFPLHTRAVQLIGPIRYITSQKEYDEIISSEDVKSSIDNFWIQKAGSFDRGRKLISTYYSRVQDANVLFTSYFEGWKTDRGMVYIVFGEPETVYRSEEFEDWTYSYGFDRKLLFSFRKMQNPFSENDFELERQKIFESPWYYAVEEWRKGRSIKE